MATKERKSRQRQAPQILSVSDRAAEQIKAIMGEADSTVIGLRVGVTTKGCSGLAYRIEYATEQGATEDVVESKGVKLFIEPTAVMFLLGTEIDWQEDKLGASFVFNNPNETARCGCGESFMVG